MNAARQPRPSRTLWKRSALSLRFDQLAVDLSNASGRLPKGDVGKAVMDLGVQLTQLGLGGKGAFSRRRAELALDTSVAETMGQSRGLAGPLASKLSMTR